MQVRVCALVAAVLAAGFSAALGGAVAQNPVEKTLELLTKLSAQVQAELEEADSAYEEFTKYCKSESRNFKYDIKVGTEESEDLKAKIAKETTDASAAEAKIEQLSGDISKAEADLKAATEVRKTEASDFSEADAELKETIDMLERAIHILSKHASLLQSDSVKGVTDALSLMVEAAAISAADAKKLTALVQTNSGSENDSDNGAPWGAPEVKAYEGHSKGIVEVLEDLLDKAQAQLSDAQKQEMEATHNYELVKQSLEDEMKFSGKDMNKAKADLEASKGAKAVAESDLATTLKSLKADKDGLANLESDCVTKAQDHAAAQESRQGELKALAAAKEAIETMTGGAEDITYGLAQTSPVSLLQLERIQAAFNAKRASSRKTAARNPSVEAVHVVRRLARQHKSQALALLASRMDSAVEVGATSGEDPFVKVRGLITEMIERLEKEADADATHKAFCDKELSENNAKKDEKTAEVEKLQTKIDTMSAQSSQLKEEVAQLQKELAELAASMAEMDKIRKEEHDQYLKDKPEMEQGIEAVKLALKVLREYYAQESPTAAKGDSTGIIGLLEVVESDFSKTLAEIETAEMAAAQSYDKTKKENEIIKATKEQDVKYKTKEATDLDKTIAETTSDLQGVQTELDAVLEYLSKLEDKCVAKPETYEARTAKRAAEIAGLKEALTILEEETAFVQKSQSRRLLRGIRAHAQ